MPIAHEPDVVARFTERNPLRRVLVNSIPKSGTTWLRTMLASLPGYTEFPMKGMTGTQAEELLAVEPGQVFHGHLMSSPRLFQILEERNFATAFIYRDIRDVIVSHYHHVTYLNPARAPESLRGLTKEEAFAADRLESWCPSLKRYPDVKVWLEREDIATTTTYEALKGDTPGELARVLKGMGFEVNSQLVEAIVDSCSFERASGGRRAGEEDPAAPARKGIVGDWQNHFSQVNAAGFQARYGELLASVGYGPDGRLPTA